MPKQGVSMNPLKILFIALALLAASTAAQTLYFYPPDDAKWIAGSIYIHNGSMPTPLEIDDSRCGWYKISVPASSALRNIAQFWLGSKGKDRIGSKGRLETDFKDINEFNSIAGNGFRLGDIFNRLGNNIFFIADELNPADPNAGWYTSDQGIIDESRCRFELAAFIYDTDPAVHPDFSCGISSGICEESPQAYSGTGGNQKENCLGVIKGLAKPTLNPTTKKIECDNCTKNQCWTNADWFNKAFTSTPGVNVERCYNMPFLQVKTGNFEFDSDKLLNANGKLVGGFFPELLNSAPNDPTCPSCNTKRSADRFTPLVSEVPIATFNEYQSKEGDFKDKDIPTIGTILGTSNTGSLYDFEAKTNAAWYLYGTTVLKNTYGDDKTTFDSRAKANQHFCFESHATFTYDPEQKFYFSGDDDIWVYINNKLVIDLGGAHVAAPDHVNLNTLGLTEGEVYPIDIFFCDRRTSQSNVRISSNMYIAQKTVFYEIKDNIKQELPLCAAIQKGADCANKMGMGGSGGEKCGNHLIQDGYTVDFYMVRKGTKDTIELSPTKNPTNCKGGTNAFTCFDGITVNNAVYTCGGRGQCKGNPAAAFRVNVTGNFTVYARLMENGRQVPGTKAIPIDFLEIETSPIIASTLVTNINARVEINAILLENLPAKAKIELYNLQGKHIYSNNSENSQILRIPVQTKGMYLVKISLGSKNTVLKVALH